MNNPDMSRAVWRKSSHSGGNGDCVEVAALPEGIGVRDSKNADGTVLHLSGSEFSELVRRVKHSSAQSA